MTDFASFVAKTLARFTQVKHYIVHGRLVQVFLDFADMNSFVDQQLDQTLSLWRQRFPGAGMAVLPYDENYKVRYPFIADEYVHHGRALLISGQHARPEPGKATANITEIRRLMDNEEE